MDEWERKNFIENTYTTCFPPMTLKEWRIYGALCEGIRKDDDDNFEGDHFAVDLDLLLAFLSDDGRVLYCSFTRHPETGNGIFVCLHASF